MNTVAELHDLQDVEELDDTYFQALLEDYLPLAG
jgi:hypothetical protein